MKNIHLVVIDPQNDFCYPGVDPHLFDDPLQYILERPTPGALYVPGADQDMERLAAMIYRLGRKISDIHVTQDSHHKIHVAHPIYWVDRNGNPPNPFTEIVLKSVLDGEWTTKRTGWVKRAINYLQNLEKNGRYPLTIWPEHCLIGHWGHNIYQPLLSALDAWEEESFGAVDYVTKGSNYHTEHYSAICADVPDPQDPSTQMNKDFLNVVMEADEILIAGEAGSHCVANTVNDADRFFNDPTFLQKVILLEDAISPVPGFEHLQEDFFKRMKSKGVRTTTTVDYLAV